MSHEVVAALIVESEKILLGLRSARRAYYPGVWDVFGGHVEPGESLEQTLIRELQEEVGIAPTEWTYLETLTLPVSDSAPVDEPSEAWTVHLYRVTAWRGTPFNRQPQEHSVVHWFYVSEAIELQLANPIYPMLFARLSPNSGREV